jgi:hypothetical protein
MSSEQHQQHSKPEDQSVNKPDSSSLIEIQRSITVMHFHAFRGLSSLTEVELGPDSRVIVINGFGECPSLCRSAIPASVEIIRGFNQYHPQQEALFLPGSRITTITGFRDERDVKQILTTYRDGIHLKHRRLHLRSSLAASP